MIRGTDEGHVRFHQPRKCGTQFIVAIADLEPEVIQANTPANRNRGRRGADLDEELGHVTEVQRDAPSLDRFQPGYGLITWLVLLHGWIDWSA